MKRALIFLIIIFISFSCRSKESILKSSNPIDHFTLGKKYYITIDLDAQNKVLAIESFEKSLKLAGMNPEFKKNKSYFRDIHNYLGELYALVNKPQKSSLNYEKYLKFGGKNISVREKYGETLYEWGRKNRSLEILLSVYKEKKDMPLTLWLLGEIYKERLDFTTAKKFYKRLFHIPAKQQKDADKKLSLLKLIKTCNVNGVFEKKLAIKKTVSYKEAILVIARKLLKYRYTKYFTNLDLTLLNRRVIPRAFYRSQRRKKTLSRMETAKLLTYIYKYKSRDIRIYSRYRGVKNPFVDVDTGRYLSDIIFTVRNELLSATFSSRFHPKQDVTGIEFIAAVVKLSKIRRGQRWK